MATVADIKAYLNIPATSDKDDAFIGDCLVLATALVDDFVGEVVVPAEVLDHCYTIVAADVFNRRKAPNGIVNQQVIDASGVSAAPMRIARDPLNGVYGILRRWVLTW